MSTAYQLQVLRDLDQTVMVGKFDDEDNTLGHIAALTGNSKLFKVYTVISTAVMINRKWHHFAGSFSSAISEARTSEHRRCTAYLQKTDLSGRVCTTEDSKGSVCSIDVGKQ